MPDVVGVRFKQCGKIYNFMPDGVKAKPGMRVIVESEMGLSLGLVVKERHNAEQPDQQFKKILRIATVRDMETDRGNRSLEDEAKDFCVKRAKGLKLPMKIVGTEATLDRKRIIFYFAAEGRIDFRELVRDLASRFKTRIEMRQIGVRDEVKSIGGIGCCGREVCCKVFLTSFEPISIRMAKKQALVLNPGKLSGICGRLMCCLGYEIGQPGRKQPASGEKVAEDISRAETKSRDEKERGKTAAPAPAPKRPARPSRPKRRARKEKASQSGPSGRPDNAKKTGGQAKPAAHKKKEQGKPFSKRKRFWRKKKK